jgi:hypothetical protein
MRLSATARNCISSYEEAIFKLKTGKNKRLDKVFNLHPQATPVLIYVLKCSVIAAKGNWV